ncbi:MAG: hypothetical protein IIV90_01690 [Oscillospiraceae bacterium]|nr:hypothetical protein [Oscillospiraceae bacterium]
MRGLICRAGLRVARGAGVVVACHGLLRRTQRRVRLSAVTACVVQAGPAARLAGRYPVYLAAGPDKGRDAPLFLCRKGDWASLGRLVPGVQMPPGRCAPPGGRSPAAFFALPGGGAALCGVGLALWPGGRPAFGVGLAFFAALALAAAEGYRREGAWRRQGRLTLCYTRRFTLYRVCLLGPPPATLFFQTPFGRKTGRGTLFVKQPGGFYKIRSLRGGGSAALGV